MKPKFSLCSRMQSPAVATCFVFIVLYFTFAVMVRLFWQENVLRISFDKGTRTSSVINVLSRTQIGTKVENSPLRMLNHGKWSQSVAHGRRLLSNDSPVLYDDNALWPKYDQPVLTWDRITSQLKYDQLMGQKSHRPKLILIFDGLSSLNANTDVCLTEKCNTRCELTEDTYKMASADAVIFRNRSPSPVVRERRPANQIWILWLKDSPFFTPRLHNFYGSINWTVSYRIDSTIVAPQAMFYGFPHEQEGRRRITLPAGKSRLIAWFSDQCETPNHGYYYVQSLQAYTTVDIYGPCGDNSLTCPKDAGSRCFSLMRAKYKFVFVMEPSNCRDSISSAFFNVLRSDTVPVVMGPPREDYERIAPPFSFIHVNDFSSARDLAAHLQYLARHQQEYEKFFFWKKAGGLTSSRPWCRLCAMLHGQCYKPARYRDIDRWWRKGACARGQSSYGTISERDYIRSEQEIREEREYAKFADEEVIFM